jgi:hypothetical protein
VIALKQTTILATVVVVLLLARFLQPIPYGRAIWDFLFVLDGAYRIGLGLIPHIDFMSPIGSLSLYMVVAAGYIFPHGNAFVGLHMMAWLLTMAPFAVLAPRLRSGPAFCAALALLALIVLIPITVDDTLLAEISYFGSYNRFATGLLFLAGLWLVLPKGRHDWLLVAYLLTALFFLKITAAVVLLGIVVAAVILGRWRLLPAMAAVAAFALALVLVQAVSGGIVGGYVEDVQAMSRINAGNALHGLLYVSYRNWTTLLVFAALVVGVLGTAVAALRTSNGGWHSTLSTIWDREAFVVDAVLLIAAALLAESQNSGGVGLIAAAALFFHPEAWRGEKIRAVLVAFLLAAMILPVANIAFNRMLTVTIRETRQTVRDQVDELFPGTSVPATTVVAGRLFRRINTEWPDFARDLEADGFQLERDPGSNAPGGMLAWIASAVDAAHSFKDNGYGVGVQHYATLAFADPFMRLLHLTPALRTTIVMDIGRTFPLLGEQEADAYLATADGVFVSLCERRTLANNDAAFQAVFARAFEKKPLNECWDFYRRKPVSG